MNTTQKKKHLENKFAAGKTFCNAIDEDPNNPDDWTERMPANGYRFYLNSETNKVNVGFVEYFSCYDGWDSDFMEIGEFNTMDEAVNAIWKKERLDEARVEGRVVEVGDVVWVKDDYETAAEITKINGNTLTLEVEGEAPWDTETRVVKASECWIE